MHQSRTVSCFHSRNKWILLTLPSWIEYENKAVYTEVQSRIYEGRYSKTSLIFRKSYGTANSRFACLWLKTLTNQNQGSLEFLYHHYYIDRHCPIYLIPSPCVSHFSHRPCMVVGPTGTGKSCYVQDKMMNELDREKYMAFFMAFSAQSTAMQTQVQW